MSIEPNGSMLGCKTKRKDNFALYYVDPHYYQAGDKIDCKNSLFI